ncbi:hypothetical protein JD844_000893 [Phrynosoma platyrhinos]|uniref:NADP-dependent oxidoreductase domain-containing protein n=1 Tax=Phrynosoma platyrhinos TaxID=52577 RepID=A0ABQ7T8X7_PHRPL|nr:hypothetical protein JD844_000893 [Phrynosoma platyrhinos]
MKLREAHWAHGSTNEHGGQKNLGKSGLRVSCLGLGTWVTFGSQISDEMAENVLTIAYENGVNLFDTAEVYASGKYVRLLHTQLQYLFKWGSTSLQGESTIAPVWLAEKTLGNILKSKGWRAETERGLSRKHIIEECDPNFRLLLLEENTNDYWGQAQSVTRETASQQVPALTIRFSPTEIVRAMTYVINQGMAMYWGTSRWSAMEIMEAYSVARQFNLIPPVCEQAEYHMFQREKVETQLPELYHKIGVGAITWSPLACGLITGKYEDRVPENCRAAMKEKLQSEDGKKQQAKVKELHPIAERLGCTVAQLAIGAGTE